MIGRHTLKVFDPDTQARSLASYQALENAVQQALGNEGSWLTVFPVEGKWPQDSPAAILGKYSISDQPDSSFAFTSTAWKHSTSEAYNKRREKQSVARNYAVALKEFEAPMLMVKVEFSGRLGSRCSQTAIKFLQRC